MINAFDPRFKPNIDTTDMERNARRSRSVSRIVEKARAKGIEPARIDINSNAHKNRKQNNARGT